MKNLTNWLNAYKIWLNVSKTEVVLFKPSRKLTDVPLKLKLYGKKTLTHKLSEISWYKYWWETYWKQQISDISIKLNNANGILIKTLWILYEPGVEIVTRHQIFSTTRKWKSPAVWTFEILWKYPAELFTQKLVTENVDRIIIVNRKTWSGSLAHFPLTCYC